MHSSGFSAGASSFSVSINCINDRLVQEFLTIFNCPDFEKDLMDQTIHLIDHKLVADTTWLILFLLDHYRSCILHLFLQQQWFVLVDCYQSFKRRIILTDWTYLCIQITGKFHQVSHLHFFIAMFTLRFRVIVLDPLHLFFNQELVTRVWLRHGHFHV